MAVKELVKLRLMVSDKTGKVYLENEDGRRLLILTSPQASALCEGIRAHALCASGPARTPAPFGRRVKATARTRARAGARESIDEKIMSFPTTWLELVNWFYQEQMARWPQYVKSPTKETIRSSLRSIDRLIRIDGFGFKKDIQPTIRWVVDDDFWSRNCLSLTQLRKKSRNGLTKFANMNLRRGESGGDVEEVKCRAPKTYDVLSKVYKEISGAKVSRTERVKLSRIAEDWSHYWKSLPGDKQASSPRKGGVKYFHRTPMSLVRAFADYLRDRFGDYTDLSMGALAVTSKVGRRFIVKEERRLQVSFKTGRRL